jgi:hypothetical protein
MVAASPVLQIEDGIRIHCVRIPEGGLSNRSCNRFRDATAFWFPNFPAPGTGGINPVLKGHGFRRAIKGA